ncbi:ABC transporter ATP-binding protein [Cellulophaga baltica]|uniref:ABC transporter ATP-binding protein n=1 Tax=Cellulophaga TaxID=104264 RepID=UPI001C07094D|nr:MULTISPECIES: ABC transporter ATP-binding protein [Cellulophaga]MBU2997410.1 ABC transporter ATP-binding protein [Cellulophaga baltica]MDO6768807.1 ABC transporter ATP-binding protein [Cellulophaga sp. 1_MG-2023]
MSIKVENINIGYKSKKQDTVIAKNISFSLKKGEITAIVGINGIGKSTLLRTIANVQPPLKGSITIDDNQITKYSALDLASKISLVLTESIASKNLTVIELIALGRQPYTNWLGTLTNIDKKKIKEAIELVEISDLQHKRCFELSDGQLQRVMIARALAQDTPIILLDEPTSHLDLYHKVQILKLLKNIAHKTNKTILYTTHEIAIAIQLCDKICILNTEESFFDTPCNLIKQNHFEKLFPTDTIKFDSGTGSFKIA